MMAGLRLTRQHLPYLHSGEAWDKSAYAAKIAERYHTDHHSGFDPNSFFICSDPPGERSIRDPSRQFGAADFCGSAAMALENDHRPCRGSWGPRRRSVFAGYRRYRCIVLKERVLRVLPGPCADPYLGRYAGQNNNKGWYPPLYRNSPARKRPLRAKAPPYPGGAGAR